ncbi:MAG: M48 family metallopeptidase [Deltaproteobacteria bacterium]|nr:M48 family metallopeptidase [Deltaproteobacteria bacterium]
MRFTPIAADGSVNVSKGNPLTEAAWLAGSLVLILVLLYVILGFVAGWAAMRLPVGAEVWLGNVVSAGYQGKSNEFLQEHLDQLLHALPHDSPLHSYTFKIYFDETDKVNAFALPGGGIVVLAGLLNVVESENELDMVLAHELGHFYHRDHLQTMGRSLLLAVGSRVLPGDRASDLVTWIGTKLERKYSQKQEAAADAWGLDLLNHRYGHVAGALDFFDHLPDREKDRFAYFLATHPDPEERIRSLQKLIRQKGYAVGKTVPINRKIVE